MVAPTNEQYPITFLGIEQLTDEKGQSKRVPFSAATMRKDYAAGGFFGNKDTAFILGHTSDYFLRKFGDKEIKRMLRDPEVRKCLTVIIVSVLESGVTIFPAVSKPMPLAKLENETPERIKARAQREKEIKRYELAKSYSEFCTRAIENLEKSFRQTLETMLFEAICYGNKVAEQTYKQIEDEAFGRTLLTLKSIRVKPRKSVGFAIDGFWKVVGFKAAYRVEVTQADGTTRTEIREDILPREKFLLLTFRGQDEDPRGTSILEAVYNAWHLKMQMWPEYLRWLLVSAIPALVGKLPPNEERRFLKDENGDILRDAIGNPIYEAEVDTLLNALVELRNATALVVPNGAEVIPVNNTTSGDPFKGMRDVLNEEIEMGILLQTLATSEGRFMSRAAAQSHMSVLDLLISFIKGLVSDMIRNDVLKPLMRINFGEESLSLLPQVTLGDTERRNFAEDLNAASNAWKSGYMGKSQKVAFDKIIGAPERDVESDDEYERGLARLDFAQPSDPGTQNRDFVEPNTSNKPVPSGDNSNSRTVTKPSREAVEILKQIYALEEQLAELNGEA